MVETVQLSVLGAFLLFLLLQRRWLRQNGAILAEQVQEALDRFRGGGPPTPMHPSPAGDTNLLQKPPKQS